MDSSKTQCQICKINRLEFNNKYIKLTNILGINQVIPIKNLLFVKAKSKYIKCFLTDDNEVTCSNVHLSIGKFVESCKLIPILVQIHKSYVVNIDKIEEYGAYPQENLTIIEKGNKFDIPIARRKRLYVHNIVKSIKIFNMNTDNSFF